MPEESTIGGCDLLHFLVIRDIVFNTVEREIRLAKKRVQGRVFMNCLHFFKGFLFGCTGYINVVMLIHMDTEFIPIHNNIL